MSGKVLRKLDLCDRCAERMREVFRVRCLSEHLCRKVTCANCGRKEYGATYEVRTGKGET